MREEYATAGTGPSVGLVSSTRPVRIRLTPMKNQTRILSLLALTATLLPAQGQTNRPDAPLAAPAAAAPALSPTEEQIQKIKKPVSWMSWGTDLRIRNEYFDNLLTLNKNNPLHEQDYFRIRARLWTSITPVDDFSLNVRLATEPREWMRPAGYTPIKGHPGLDMTEGVFDSLSVRWTNIMKLPASLTVGRQDLLLGDGWLVGDGTPQDGSWTYFLDSARLVYNLPEQHTTIEAIGILQNAHDDAWMPTINNNDRILTDQNEKGAILSVANTSLKAANLTGYFIYKHDNRLSDVKMGKYGDNADIYTVGGRVSGLLDDHWKYSAEGAYQFGQKQDPNIKSIYLAPSAVTTGFRDLDAFGVNSKLTYLFKDKLNNQVGVSYEFLTGDNPKSKNDEMFDVLWGRWPRWAEIGLYMYAPEARIGQEANLHRFGPTYSVSPMKNLDFTASYYALFSEEQVATRAAGPGLFSNSGNFRGHFVQGVLKYKFSQHLSGHLWSEFLFPGDYYVQKTMIPFLRAEVSLAF